MDNNVIISDQMFLGAYDAEGSHLIVINSYLPRKGSKKSFDINSNKQPFGIDLKFDFAQSNSKADLVIKMADKFGIKTFTDKKDTNFRVGIRTPEGQKLRDFFLKNKPLYPGHRRDFLLSEEILVLLDNNVQSTKQGLVTLITLAYQNSANVRFKSRKTPIDFWLGYINASQSEYDQGMAAAAPIIAKIEKEEEFLEKTLPTMTLPLDYIRGAHVGDGGLTVALGWKPAPNSKQDRRRIEPQWTISGQNKAYCEAFVHTLGGGINKSGPNCSKFLLSGKENLRNVFYLFEKTWLPDYKKGQFQKFKEAIRMLFNEEHLTEKGTIALVELVFQMSEKGIRLDTKAKYIQWGLEWLRRRSK